MVEVGKEAEFVVYRLNDIIYLAEKTMPIGDDWKSYAEAVLGLIAKQARAAQKYLHVAADVSSETK